MPHTTRIRDLPTDDLPRERLTRHGGGALSTAELVAIVVRSGGRGNSALQIAQDLVARFGLRGLADAPVDDLCTVAGCGPATAVQIKAALELGRRLVVPPPDARHRITAAADIARLLTPEMGSLDQEHLRVVLLTTRHDIVAVHEVYKGSVNQSQVRPAEVFREAIRRNAPAVIVVHNHPSGDPAPSHDDILLTRQLVQVGRLLGVRLLDHVVIARHGWVSLREVGQGFEGV
ncbi:MAG: DNA repair protein RadC [Ardenticatenales bacterium]|nr:DNA repair protein RadC [Ardenticatenales bacterium]